MGRLDLDLAWALEERLLSEFRRRAHLFGEIPAQLLEAHQCLMPLAWLPYIQHHGGPTRLLDWTRSPYIGAYFAVVEENDDDGALWHFNLDALYDSSAYVTAQILGPEWEKEQKPQKLGVAPLLYLTERMVAQQAVLTFCTHLFTNVAEVLGRASELELTKLIIPDTRKGDFLLRLHKMGITASALFPGLDGLGRSLGEMAEIQAYGHVVLTPEPITMNMSASATLRVKGGMGATAASPPEPELPENEGDTSA